MASNNPSSGSLSSLCQSSIQIIRDAPILKLPDKLLIEIFSYLSLKERGKALPTCRCFSYIADLSWHSVNSLALSKRKFDESVTVWKQFGLQARKFHRLQCTRDSEKSESVLKVLLPKIGQYLHYLDVQDENVVGHDEQKLKSIVSMCQNLKSVALHLAGFFREDVAALAKVDMIEELSLTVLAFEVERLGETLVELFARLSQLKVLRLAVTCLESRHRFPVGMCVPNFSRDITHFSLGGFLLLEPNALVDFLKQSPKLIFYEQEGCYATLLDLLALNAPQLETIHLSISHPEEIPETKHKEKFHCLKSLKLSSFYYIDAINRHSIVTAFPLGVLEVVSLAVVI